MGCTPVWSYGPDRSEPIQRRDVHGFLGSVRTCLQLLNLRVCVHVRKPRSYRPPTGGRRIIPSRAFRDDTRFDAYDRLTDLDEKGLQPDLGFVMTLVSDMIRVDGARFSYPLNPSIVSKTLRHIEPALNQRFRLPEEWSFTDYTLAQYVRVAKSLWAISAIHFVSRLIAAGRGCLGLGYSRALVVMSDEELYRRLARYTGLDDRCVRAVVSDLTFGAGEMRSPDPALQPLVRLTKTVLGWAPGLLLNNALERNLTVLLNRLPDARDAYARLSQHKEALLRTQITDDLRGLQFRFWHGEVGAWEKRLDVDLAIVSEQEKCCLLLELKSFIGPAEAREIRDRSEEIARGIQQVKARQTLMQEQPQALRDALQVSSEFDLEWAVASETSIGAIWVQDDSVPVVRAGHLVRKLCQSRRLVEVCEWLRKREYLPVEGRDYEVVDVRVTIANWELDWYGIKGLGESEADDTGEATKR